MEKNYGLFLSTFQSHSILKQDLMLRVETFTFNPFQENTYLLINDDNECWIVDPGMYGVDEEQAMFRFIADNQLKPQQVINTHAHIDHVLGIDAMKQKYGIPFGMHQLDQPVLANAGGSAMMFGFNFGATPVVDFFIDEHKPLQLGKDEVTVRFTPGHSPGSIVFYYEPGQWVIGGDVLFLGSVGRTDLPGGDHEVLMNSIQSQLYVLPDETVVHPGHGPATHIGHEKKTNPFIRG